tara:strand:+ start:5740 stop:6237 length:498 start_codon:yes stop_codon:yes gene_type:complete
MTGDGTNWRVLREAYKEFGVQFDPTDMVNLAINQTCSIEKVRRLVGDLAARLDDWALGARWSTTHHSKRANGIFFVEHTRSNVHVHGLVNFPYANRWGRQMMTQHFWQHICPSGTVVVERAYDAFGAADYMTKEMKWRDYNGDQIILLADLMSEKSLTRKPTKQR